MPEVLGCRWGCASSALSKLEARSMLMLGARSLSSSKTTAILFRKSLYRARAMVGLRLSSPASGQQQCCPDKAAGAGSASRRRARLVVGGRMKHAIGSGLRE